LKKENKLNNNKTGKKTYHWPKTHQIRRVLGFLLICSDGGGGGSTVTWRCWVGFAIPVVVVVVKSRCREPVEICVTVVFRKVISNSAFSGFNISHRLAIAWAIALIIVQNKIQ